MAETTKPDAGTAQMDVEKLAHALVSRGLITREEFQQVRGGGADGTGSSPGELLLARLVKAGFLTASQAHRAGQELEQLLNQSIPGYQLLEKLGQGSMGQVFKARQLSMDRLVAIKTLHPRLAANPEDLVRFTREAHLAAKFSSNNVVQAIDVGSAGGNYYLSL